MSGPYQQQPPPPRPYGAPAQPYEGQGQVYGSQGQQYGAPAPAYGTPSQDYGSQGQQYGSPAPTYGTPSQDYGSPGQQYGSPAQQYGSPTGYPVPPVVPEKRRNGFAITALVFGIIGGIPLALGFGIAGLVRSGKVRRGKAMSIVAIVLALLWIVPVVALTQRAEKLADPGCIQAENLANNFDTKVTADTNNPAALKNDLASTVSQLDAAAAKSTNDTARAAIKKLSADIKELLDDLNNAKAPAADLESRVKTDGDAVDTACGRI